MPLVEENEVGGFVGYQQPKAEPAPPPSWADTAGAAFRLENDVVAAYDLVTRNREYKSDPLFNPVTKMRDWDAANRTNLWDNYRENFIGVRSEAEFMDILSRINQEQKDKETLSNAGWGGIVMSIAAGILSPTMLMPFIGQERGLAAFGKGALMGGAAGAAQEIPLQLAQETRTGAEGIGSIAAATVIGGVLGGAVGALRKGEFDHLVRQLDVEGDMVRSTVDGAIQGGSVGAALANPREYAGRLKAAKAAKIAAWLGPVTRVINQSENQSASWFMSQLADAGLRLEGNVSGVNTSAGGTIESLVKPYYGQYAVVTESLDQNYAKYIYGENIPGLAPNMRASLVGMWNKEKLSKAEFREAISQAIWQGGHVIPEVQAVAKEIQDRILTPMLKQGQERGLFGEVKQTKDKFYFPHQWRSDVIERRQNEFIDKLAKGFAEKLNEDFGEKLAKLQERGRRDALLAEDLVRPKEEVEALRAELSARMRELTTGKRTVEGKSIADYIKELSAKEIVDQDGVPLEPWQLRDIQIDAKLAFLRDNGITLDGQKGFSLSQIFRDPWWASTEWERRVANLNDTNDEIADAMNKLPPEKDIENFLKQATNVNEEKPFSIETIVKVFPDEFKERAQILALDPSFDSPNGPDLGLIRLFEEAYPDFARLRDAQNTVPESFEAGQATQKRFTPDFEKILDQMISTIERPSSVEQFIPQRLLELQDQIADLRSLARRSTDRLEKADFLRQARELEKSGGEDLASLKAQRSEIRRRQQGLARAAVALEDRQLKKLAAIEKIEDVNTRQLESVARAGQRILNKLDTVSDAALDKELKNLGEQFTELGVKLDKAEEAKAKLANSEQPDTVRLLGIEERAESISERMSAIARDMEAVDTIDRASVRASIQEALEEVKAKALNDIERRLARENKLIEAAAKLDPAEAARRVNAIKSLSKERKLEFLEQMRLRGADNIDLNARTADFTAYSREIAEEATKKILGSPVRIPITDIIQGQRGPELARVLDVSSEEFKDFLQTDIEHVLRAYLRTMAPDIEMARKFGSVNGQSAFDAMEQEYRRKLAALGKEKLEPKAREKAEAKLKSNYDKNLRDLNVVIGRLRGTWGLPANPDGMAYRMGRMVMNLNVLRLMGGTLIASIPDAARPIQRYGLTRTFRDAFVPMISDWKTLKIAAREAKYAGAALDAIMHTRAQSINDVLDDYGRHSKFERGLEYATNRLGMVALFDPWTVAMKQVSASVIIGKLSDSLDIVYGGAKATAKEVKEAQEFLAAKGLNNNEIGRRIYAQLTSPEGGNKVKDVWLPNTESWTDVDATRAYRGALASEINNTIITPGVERPAWMDKNIAWRLLGQFKSFGMSATYKIALAGVQQRDMAFFNGTMVSLALGALSYYLSAVSAGGDTYQKMLKAGPGKFADEAINRSGVLGIFSDAQRFMERIPATQPYVSFSGERTTRRGGDDIVDVVLGPTFGLAKTGAKALAGMDDPTKSTLHNIRQMMPWQNLIGWRRILDAIEAQANLPERRN